MLEFSSISVSTYDSASLADRLTEHSALGWTVVSIVQTGTTVTAFVSRPAETSASAASPAVLVPEVVEATPNPSGSSDSPIDLTIGSSSIAADTSLTSTYGDTALVTSLDTAAATSLSSSSDSSARTAAASASESTQSGAVAPAGWYADPANRFELRYWDGDKWTEYVSRGGQQFTDPPVA